MQIEPIFNLYGLLPAWFINFLTFPLLEGLTFITASQNCLKGVFYVTNYRPDLDGLSCGHCVKRVKESLEQRPDVEQADVSITEAHVTGTASAEQLIETIKQAGYDASVSHPKAKPLAESSIPSEALTAVSEALPAATADDDDSQQLLLSGMSCASCVTRVQNALQSVPGVTQARVNWRSVLRW